MSADQYDRSKPTGPFYCPNCGARDGELAALREENARLKAEAAARKLTPEQIESAKESLLNKVAQRVIEIQSAERSARLEHGQ